MSKNNKVKQFPVRLSEEHLSMIDKIKDHYSFMTTAETIRFCIQKVFTENKNEEK